MLLIASTVKICFTSQNCDFSGVFTKVVKISNHDVKVINLSEPLLENVAVFPGDPTPQKHVVQTLENGNCQYHAYTLGDHHFHPHGDAPSHHNPDYQSRGFEFWGMDYAFNSACLIDLANDSASTRCLGIDFLTEISARHLVPHSDKLGKCGAVILRTGYDRWIEANHHHEIDKIPYLNPEAADFLAEFGNVHVVGIDSLTVDKPGRNYAHRKLKEKFIVECLVHLYLIPKESHSHFLLQTSPIAIVGATGGPVAAHAFIEQ